MSYPWVIDSLDDIDRLSSDTDNTSSRFLLKTLVLMHTNTGLCMYIPFQMNTWFSFAGVVISLDPDQELNCHVHTLSSTSFYITTVNSK